jgi:hypothetical protein
MDEQTVNDDSLFDASDVEAVANDSTTEQAENTDGSAVEVTNEQTDSQDETIEEPAVTATTQTGDAIDEFLAKKGINASDPDALRKVAEMYRNSEKGFYNKSQEAAQLQRQLAQQRVPQVQADAGQQALNEMRSMRIEMDTKEWKAKHNLSPEDEQKMVEYVSAPLTDRQGNVIHDPVTGVPLTKGLLVNNGAMSLDDVYRLAGCGVQKVDNLKQNLRQEVEKEMAARQAAKRPSAKATDSTQFGKAQEDDPFLSGLMG